MPNITQQDSGETESKPRTTNLESVLSGHGPPDWYPSRAVPSQPWKPKSHHLRQSTTPPGELYGGLLGGGWVRRP